MKRRARAQDQRNRRAADERLKRLDKVAYVRFASVYLDFKDVKEFMSELKNLLKDRGVRK